MPPKMQMPAGANTSLTTTTAEFALGTRGYGENNTEWLYVQASGAIDQYDCVTIDEDGQAKAATNTTAAGAHFVGWAQIDFANDAYGWVPLKGSNIMGDIADNASADSQLYFSGTAGRLNTVSTMGGGTAYVALDGVVVVAAASGGGASELLATYPTINV